MSMLVLIRNIEEMDTALEAANANLKTLRSYFHIPARMLLIGLPGVITLGFIVAFLLFDELSIFEAAILGTMLAATDAALGQAVITNRSVPARIREGLNVESGLNDGLCVPILLVFIALAEGVNAGGGGTTLALELVVKELGIGIAIGLVLAAVGSWLIRIYAQRDWITDTWVQVTVVALAIAAFSIARNLHGSGYIAAFVGGLLFGHLARDGCMSSNESGTELGFS
jgi:sodium/hydrogen antiporter